VQVTGNFIKIKSRKKKLSKKKEERKTVEQKPLLTWTNAV
jgi:hypothetical protein